MGEMGHVVDRNDFVARGVGSCEAGGAFMVPEGREQNKTFTSKGREQVRDSREWFSHGEDGAETSLPLSGLRARLQERRGRSGSTSKQDFEADTPSHAWFLDRQNATYQGWN